jgi:flagellar hook-basal body complex protein FliE
MSIDSLFASRAYGDVMAQGKMPSKGLSGPDEAKPGQSFGDMVKAMVNDTVETSKQSESMTVAALSNEAEMIDVVTAITSAEVTLETVVAVRDKVIEAYQSIMRMPI